MIQFFPSLLKERFTGVLDNFQAETAYSLRKLRKDYDGFAVRVRRSSDNDLLDIGFLPDGSFNESALLSFVGGGDGFVNTWYDQSGNNRDFTEGTSPYFIVQNGNTQKINGKVSIFAPIQTSPKNGLNDISLQVNVNQNNGFHIIDVSNLNRDGNARFFSLGRENDFMTSINGGVLLFSGTQKRIEGIGLPNNTQITIDQNTLKEMVGESGGLCYWKQNNSNAIDSSTRTYNRTSLLLNIMGEIVFNGRSPSTGNAFEKIFFSDFNEQRRQFIVNNINEYYSLF